MSTSARRSAGVVAVAAALAAGCGATAAQQPPPGASTFRRLVAAYDAYASCARAHGMPGLPDPQVDDQGNDHYPALDARGHWAWPQSVRNGCEYVWVRVHAIRDEFDSLHAQRQSPVRFADARALASCIRRHGFPTFPDPTPEGGFVVGSLPAGFEKPNLSSQAASVLRLCGRSK